jgi:hypothetical protein
MPDCSRPHTANQTAETVNELRFELMKRPQYSPDFVPSDSMFGPMKEALRGRRFSSDEEVIRAVQNRFKDPTKKLFFSDGI